MPMRTNPFRELDRWGLPAFGSSAGAPAVPMDAYRQGEEFVVAFDLPGIDPASIDLTVEHDVLTVRAERTLDPQQDAQVLVAERPRGTFTRRVLLGDALDTGAFTAQYADGVLTLRVPVAAKATRRKIEIGAGREKQLTA